jgi:hypothetical protein
MDRQCVDVVMRLQQRRICEKLFGGRSNELEGVSKALAKLVREESFPRFASVPLPRFSDLQRSNQHAPH